MASGVPQGSVIGPLLDCGLFETRELFHGHGTGYSKLSVLSVCLDTQLYAVFVGNMQETIERATLINFLTYLLNTFSWLARLGCQ